MTGELAHNEGFGFLCLRQAFSAVEMEETTRGAERVWAQQNRAPGALVIFNQYL